MTSRLLILLLFSAFVGGCGPASTLPAAPATLQPLPTYTPYPTETPYVVTATAMATGTLMVVVPTSPPRGAALIGALNNDGSLAADSSQTNAVVLYPKTLVDATGQLHGDMNGRVVAFPDRQTGIAAFSDLEPATYVVCFEAPGGSLKVGEITLQPNVELRQNFKWPPTWEIGSQCQL